MADIVVNNEVKMEWLKKNWLQTAARKGKQSLFILAAQTYPTSDGRELAVFFNCSTAFLFIDNAGEADEDIWTVPDLFNTLKEDLPGTTFPTSYTQYVPIIEAGYTECDVYVLSKYGLLDAKADIEARLLDLEPYGYESVSDMM